MSTTRIPIHKCRCGEVLDAATDARFQEFQPEPGDLSVCIGCGRLGIFTKKMTLRSPSPEEKLLHGLNPIVIAAQIQIRGR